MSQSMTEKHPTGDRIEPVRDESTVGTDGEGDLKQLEDRDHTDIALDSYQMALQLGTPRLEELSKRAKLKLDFILLPLMCLVYLISFLEKASLNYANAYNLQADLKLVGRDYAWSAAILNLGIMIGSYPCSVAVQKLPVGKFMAAMALIWGALTMAVAGTKNFGGIFAIRFIMGIFEAAIGPAWVVLTSMFWTRDEQPLRMCFWLGSNGIAQLLGAGISVGLGRANSTAVSSWQLIFLVIGSLSILVGVVCLLVLPSSPNDAKFLTPDERLACVWRIAVNQTGVKHSKFMKHQALEALRDPRVHLLLVQQFAVGFLNGAISNYFSAFLRGFGWSSMDAVLYQLPIGAVQIVTTVLAGFLASRIRNSTFIILLAVTVFPLAALIGWSTIPSSEKMALTACSWIIAPYSAAVILNWSIVAANFAGHTKRTIMNAINFAAFYAGNFAGPFVFDPVEAPRYPTATKILGGMVGLIWVVTAAMGFIMWRANKARDAKAAAGDARYQVSQGTMFGFTDYTDKENKAFRYRL